MSVTLDALARAALELPVEQRLELASRWLASMDPESGANAAWETTIVERIARYDASPSSTVPATEVFNRLRKIEFVAAVRQGLAEIENGEGIPLEEVARELPSWVDPQR